MIYYSFLNDDFYGKFGNSHAAEHNAAMKLLEYAVTHDYGLSKLPEIAVGSHGKPFFTDSKIMFNLAHCDGMAVCAAELYPVGVDCEKCGRISIKAARRIFTESEKSIIENSDNASEDFMRIWTAKEAYGKAIGRGLHDDLAEIELYSQSRAGDIYLKNFEVVSGSSKYFICEAIRGEKVSDKSPVYIEIK